VSDEIEISQGQRAWGASQALLGAPSTTMLGMIKTGWYDTQTSPYRGAFALVNRGGPYEALVGEVLELTRGTRTSYVYVVGAANLPTDFALARRAFLSLGALWNMTIDVVGAIV
jgi:hypothetical protein